MTAPQLSAVRVGVAVAAVRFRPCRTLVALGQSGAWRLRRHLARSAAHICVEGRRALSQCVSALLAALTHFAAVRATRNAPFLPRHQHTLQYSRQGPHVPKLILKVTVFVPQAFIKFLAPSAYVGPTFWATSPPFQLLLVPFFSSRLSLVPRPFIPHIFARVCSSMFATHTTSYMPPTCSCHCSD